MAIMALLGWHSVPFFITVVILFSSLGAFSGPAWASMMSDLVDGDKRGEYFGWRNKVLGYMVVAFTFVAGFILNQMKSINIFYGFAIIFGCAFLFRMVSWYFLTRMYEPRLEHRKEDCFSLFNFLARIRESNFAKFVLFVAMLNFSVNFAAPFFAVLMLRDLHFSYILYTIITVTATLTIFTTMSRWGRHADKVGNLRVMKFTSPIIAIIPLLWIISRKPVFLIFVQIVSGFAWAGFNLCASNFIYDAVTPPKRTRCIAYFNVLNGLALCAGALLGGLIVEKMPALLGYKILSLFVLSSLFRLITAFFGPMKLKEVRPVKHITSDRLFFSMVGIRPFLGVARNVSYTED
jgi:MFS family permease